MSIENANTFVNRLREHDAELIKILPQGIDPEAIGIKEIEDIAKSAQIAGWEFSADELKDAYLDSLVLDEGELSTVAGGDGYALTGGYTCASSEFYAQGPGGCSTNYYSQPCKATVEAGSKCSCDDYSRNYFTKA